MRETALVASLARQKAVAAHWQAEWATATTALAARSDGVTVTRTAWDSAVKKTPVRPTTAADTAAALAQLPALVAAGNALADSAKGLQVAAAAAAQAGDSAITSTNRVVATQDTLVEVVRYRARLTGAGTFLFDPLAKVPAIRVGASWRVVGSWSLLATADHRFERAPVSSPSYMYVGVSRSF